jgi:hypothetical protein
MNQAKDNGGLTCGILYSSQKGDADLPVLMWSSELLS